MRPGGIHRHLFPSRKPRYPEKLISPLKSESQDILFILDIPYLHLSQDFRDAVVQIRLSSVKLMQIKLLTFLIVLPSGAAETAELRRY
jgi:hypothetical protein